MPETNIWIIWFHLIHEAESRTAATLRFCGTINSHLSYARGDQSRPQVHARMSCATSDMYTRRITDNQHDADIGKSCWCLKKPTEALITAEQALSTRSIKAVVYYSR